MKALLLRGLIAAGAVLVLGAVDAAILHKEAIRRDGELVYLPLAPVDPRSLVQGDYMALRFVLAREIEARARADRHALDEGESAFAPLALDDRHVASLAAGASGAPLRMRYRIRQGQVWLGTNAFFFEEGSAERFRAARYGEFRLDRRSGEAVLVGLRGAALEGL